MLESPPQKASKGLLKGLKKLCTRSQKTKTAVVDEDAYER